MNHPERKGKKAKRKSSKERSLPLWSNELLESVSNDQDAFEPLHFQEDNSKNLPASAMTINDDDEPQKKKYGRRKLDHDEIDLTTLHNLNQRPNRKRSATTAQRPTKTMMMFNDSSSSKRHFSDDDAMDSNSLLSLLQRSDALQRTSPMRSIRRSASQGELNSLDHTAFCYPFASALSPTKSETSHHHQQQQQEQQQPESQQQQQQQQRQVVKVSPDFWVYMREKQETWNSFLMGGVDALRFTTCSHCREKLASIRDAEFVQCPTCGFTSLNGNALLSSSEQQQRRHHHHHQQQRQQQQGVGGLAVGILARQLFVPHELPPPPPPPSKRKTS